MTSTFQPPGSSLQPHHVLASTHERPVAALGTPSALHVLGPQRPVPTGGHTKNSICPTTPSTTRPSSGITRRSRISGPLRYVDPDRRWERTGTTNSSNSTISITTLVSLPDFAVSRSPSGRLNIDIVWDVNGALLSPFPRRFAVGVETARRSTVRRSRAFPGGRLPTRSIARSLARARTHARTHSLDRSPETYRTACRLTTRSQTMHGSIRYASR